MPASTSACKDCDITGDELYTRPIAARNRQVYVSHGLHRLADALNKLLEDTCAIWDHTDAITIKVLERYSIDSNLNIPDAISDKCKDKRTKKEICRNYFPDSDADWSLGQKLGTGSMTGDELWQATVMVVDKLLTQINSDGVLTINTVPTEADDDET